MSNRFVGVNYWDTNPNMAVPPEYWLQRLYDRDADLVVFPSIQQPFAYVLARRARRTGGMNHQDPKFAEAAPDTKYCVAHRLLPVGTIVRTGGGWSIDNIIANLDARDIWKIGGSEKMADQMDANDALDEQQLKAEIRDDMWQRSGDAWRSYQARTGQRTRTHYGHRTAKQTA